VAAIWKNVWGPLVWLQKSGRGEEESARGGHLDKLLATARLVPTISHRVTATARVAGIWTTVSGPLVLLEHGGRRLGEGARGGHVDTPLRAARRASVAEAGAWPVKG